MAASCLSRMGVVVVLALAAVAPAGAAGPGSELTKLTDPDDTYTSSDGQVIIEQYWKDKGEYDRVYEYWAFDAKHEHGVLLNRDQYSDDARYPARISLQPQQPVGGAHAEARLRHTRCSCTGATGSGLRRRRRSRSARWSGTISTASRFPARSIGNRRTAIRSIPLRSIWCRGDDNYASQARHWPDSRNLVLSLSFVAQGEDHPLPWVEDWQVVFDTKTDKFSIPADLAKNNAETIRYPAPKRK